MSCPIPIRIINPHYKKWANELGEDVFNFEDRSDFYLDVPCGKCYQCVKRYKSQWSFRLNQHYRYLSSEAKRNSFFITLTFEDAYLPSTKEESAVLVRKFLERVRKKHKRSVTHFIVSEHGKTTHRYHFHGILFDCPFDIRDLSKFWKYGFTSSAPLTPRRITYVTTYINKQMQGLILKPEDKQHLFVSPGIGKAFADDNRNINVAHPFELHFNPIAYNGSVPFALPRYLRQKLFSWSELEVMKMAYYDNLSEDVIPPGPYFIGKRRFDDYTIYLSECQKLKKLYLKYYGFQTKQSYKPIDECRLARD